MQKGRIMSLKFILPLAAAALAFAAPAYAAGDEGAASELPERISFLAPIGDEKCPEAKGDEIVVCAPITEGDRYRIPRRLRKKPDVDLPGGSWTSAVENLDEYARLGRPNSCSVVGSNGFTGCTQKMIRDWFAERRGKTAAKVKTAEIPDIVIEDEATETDAADAAND